MAITVKGSWLKTLKGDWVNSGHVDLLEVKKSGKDDTWQIQAWNALQPQVDAYVLGVFDDEAAARSGLDALIATLSK